MNALMRVLVLSVTAGGGHNSTANAIKAYLDGKGVECRVMDTLRYINKPLAKTVSEGYEFVASKAKLVFDEGYRLAEKRKRNADVKSQMRRNGKLLSRKLGKYIAAYDPDVIVFTHIFVGVILDVLKVEKGLRAKTVGILTDFVFHPYWEESTHLDYVITACPQLSLQARKKGFREEQILPMGIPIHPRFSVLRDKAESRRALGLDPDKTTFLLMAGSMGYGNMTSTVEQLYRMEQDFQLIIVCGKNEKAREAIEALPQRKTARIVGWSNEIDRFMDAADCIITKPGGLTTSESLAKCLPMIIVNPIPGQEDRNTQFLLNNGAAIAVTETFPLDEAVYTLLANPDRIPLMKQSIELLRRPDSTEQIGRLVLDLGAEVEKNK
ncbi:MAG: galactosyldiacylglycerol synthase [Clostridia bacterium]|nr:galactosyldiacylglycerol synthase [Clostridia bacterium]